MSTSNQSHKWQNLFNTDFYPTPEHVLQAMQIDCRGLKVLEPSAGKGNIIDYLKENGAKEVMFCEINKELSHICQSKARFLEYNFLDVRPEQVSHIDMIVMNPPFSEWKKHIDHAYKIAPDGCTIISLCNSDSIRYLRRESEIGRIIADHSNVYDLGSCFEEAERRTNVDVSCIHIFKPNYDNESTFEGFYMGSDDEFPESTEAGIISYDEIQSLVNSYIGALKQFDVIQEALNTLGTTCKKFDIEPSFEYKLQYSQKGTNKVEFAKELQRIAWKHIFSFMNMNKYMTRGVMSDINRFIENQSNVPFTRRNIFRMIEIIFGTREQNLNRALVEAVDKFTKHTHENRFGVDGWKTNAGHLLNKKFIVDWVFEKCESYSRMKGLKLRYSSNAETIDDLVKVLCNLTGRNYDSMTTLYGFIDRFNGLEPNKWYSWGFFEIKGFKKGTIHIKFQNEDEWWALNKKYGEIKGFTLPEKL